MLVKSLIDTKVETIEGKKEVKIGEIFECKYSVFEGLKTMYSKNFIFFPNYVFSLEDCIVENVSYKKKTLIEVSYKKFLNLKSLHKNSFIFINSVDDYKKYKIDLGKVEEIEIEEVGSDEVEEKKKRGRPSLKINLE